MALSVFLIGSVVIIVIVAFMFFVNVVHSGVVDTEIGEAGDGDPLGMGWCGRAKKGALLFLGCSKTLGTTSLHEFPPAVYKPR